MIVTRIVNFFKRIFTNSKFPARTKGRADKNVDDVYDVKTMDSRVEGKKMIILDPKESEVETEEKTDE